MYFCFIQAFRNVNPKSKHRKFSAHSFRISFLVPKVQDVLMCQNWTVLWWKFCGFSGSGFNPSIPAFVCCRSCGLQDGSLCADHRHRDGHPHNDLHRHREIPGHRIPAENEEALLTQKSIQDARYYIYSTMFYKVHPSHCCHQCHMVSSPDSLRPTGLVWIASVLVGSPMLFVQQLEVGVRTTLLLFLAFP